MRLGLYGGSFDPIHLGHVDPVREAAQALALDRVLYLPTGRPPHKRGRRLAPVWARYAMVEMALLDSPELQVSAFELRLDKPSFTFETVEYFQRERPDDDIVLLLGSDSYRQLDQWREWRRILAAAELGVLQRPGAELDHAELAPSLAKALEEGRAKVVHNQPVALSSSEIRALLGDRNSEVAPMLHPLVLNYVAKYELYT